MVLVENCSFFPNPKPNGKPSMSVRAKPNWVSSCIFRFTKAIHLASAEVRGVSPLLRWTQMHWLDLLRDVKGHSDFGYFIMISIIIRGYASRLNNRCGVWFRNEIQPVLPYSPNMDQHGIFSVCQVEMSTSPDFHSDGRR